MKRRKITLHSFRRFVKTVISDQTDQDYSEWFVGHSKSPYYTKKEPERREIYATKCMKYVTFLDYSTLEATGKNIESKLSEKEKEIQLLRQREHVLPQSGWVSYWINRGEEDIPEVIELFRMRYEQLKPKSQIKQENKEEEGTVLI
jgi:hypothetical protein